MNTFSPEICRLDNHEMPLKIQLSCPQKKMKFIELRLVQVRDPLTPMASRGRTNALLEAESIESLDEEGGHHTMPKEEGENG